MDDKNFFQDFCENFESDNGDLFFINHTYSGGYYKYKINNVSNVNDLRFELVEIKNQRKRQLGIKYNLDEMRQYIGYYIKYMPYEILKNSKLKYLKYVECGYDNKILKIELFRGFTIEIDLITNCVVFISNYSEYDEGKSINKYEIIKIFNNYNECESFIINSEIYKFLLLF